MKKTLMTMAVAGTFGLSAAAFAGPNHEVVTPSAGTEAGENIHVYKKGFSDSYDQSAIGSSSQAASGWLNGSSASSAMSSMDESLALGDEGIYSDYYVVSFSPVMAESWDLYVLNVGEPSELAAANELGIEMPTHELALISSDDDSTFELALVPIDEMSDAVIGG